MVVVEESWGDPELAVEKLGKPVPRTANSSGSCWGAAFTRSERRKCGPASIPFAPEAGSIPQAAQEQVPAKGDLLRVLFGAGQDKALSQAGGVRMLCPRQQIRGVSTRDGELGVVLAERK